MSPMEGAGDHKPSSTHQIPDGTDYLFEASCSPNGTPTLNASDFLAKIAEPQTDPNDDEQGLYASDDEAGFDPSSADRSSSPCVGGTPRYPFREGPRKGQHIIADWRDQDPSGDFDIRTPYASDGIQSRGKSSRARREAKSPGDDEVIHDARAGPSLQFRRQNGLQLPVILHIDSDTWRVKLQALRQCQSQYDDGRGRGDDNWPEDGIEPALNRSFIAAENILNHRRSASAGILDYDCLQSENDDDDVCDVDVGDPRARGCKGCFFSGDACSMVEGGKYPCTQCNTTFTCELISEPLFKMACASCEPESCSHAVDCEQSGPCNQCAQREKDCIFVPLNHLPSPFPRFEDNYEIKHERIAMFDLAMKLRAALRARRKAVAEAKAEAKVQADQQARQNAKATTAMSGHSPKRGRADEEAASSSPINPVLENSPCLCGSEPCRCGSPTRQAPSQSPAAENSLHAIAIPEAPKQKKQKISNKQKGQKGQTKEKRGGQNRKAGSGKKRKSQGTGTTDYTSWAGRDVASRSSQLPIIPAATFYSIPHRFVKRNVNDIDRWEAAPPTVKLQSMYSEPNLEEEEGDVSMEEDTWEPPPSPPPPPRSRPERLIPEAPPVARYSMSGALPPPPRNIGHPFEMRTRMAHPVRLNYLSHFECLWCSFDFKHIFKTIIGIPEMTFEAQETEYGYIATSELFKFSNEDQPKMCETHTLRKTAAAVCRHQFERVPDARHKSSTDALYSVVEKGRPKAARCSVCLNWALYRCAKYYGWPTQHIDAGVTYSDGCSLQLCADCFEGVAQNGDSVVRYVGGNLRHDRNFDVLRADAHLFGHCARRMAVSNGFG